MRILTITVFICLVVSRLFAADGYKIKLHFTDRKNEKAYLAFYYGKGIPTIYKVDSTLLDKRGKGTFSSDKKIVGGIYLILPEDRSSYFELILNNGDAFNVKTDMSQPNPQVSFDQSPENEDFQRYHLFLDSLRSEQRSWMAQLGPNASKEDTLRIDHQIKEAQSKLEQFRNVYRNTHPSNFLSAVFGAMRSVEVPTELHYTSDGKVDSSFAYRYYKNHFWDGFDWSDNRLIHTPLLAPRLDEFFNRVVYQQEDSVIVEADKILAKAKESEDLFKFTLNWLSTNAQKSKIMGMDKVFVHLVDNYYMKGDAPWLSAEELSKYIDRAKQIAPTVINQAAADFVADDLQGKEHRLYDFKAKYTLLIFYSSDCGHCKHELPLIDSLYQKQLKDRGVRVIAFNVHKDEQQWKDLIQKDHLEQWLNLWDPSYKSKFWLNYDTQLVPAIYLLDENKIIRGKKLDHTNISKVLDITEMKKVER